MIGHFRSDKNAYPYYTTVQQVTDLRCPFLVAYEEHAVDGSMLLICNHELFSHELREYIDHDDNKQ